MSFDVQAAHEALADQLRAVLGDTFNVYAFPERGGTMPMAEVAPGPSWVSPFGTLGPNGHGDVSVVVVFYLEGLTSEDRARWAFKLASAGLGESGSPQPESVLDIVLADKTLGGRVATCTPFPGDSIRWDPENDTVEVPLLMVLKKSGAQA